jgi:RNA polymerase sigma-70 factor (ECF subfamily)
LNQLKEIKDGSEKTFTEVYNQYHVKLYRFLYKKTKSDEFATELVQIVFIKLWNFKHTLSDTISFDAQLFNIARTCLIDYLRKESTRKDRLVGLQKYADFNFTNQPDLSFETVDYFNNMIQSLPPARKKIFVLSRLQGLTYKEIAENLSISVNTVEDHMTKAIRQIKKITSYIL